MAKSSSGRWSYLLFLVALTGFVTWSRTRNLYWALGAAFVAFVLVGSWLAGGNAISAYAQVAERAAEAAHAPHHGEAYAVRRLLTRFRYEPSVENLADLALTQLKDVEAHFRHFEKSLSHKLNEGELTYDRYHTAAQQAFDGVLHNLRNSASLIEQLLRARNSDLVTKLETTFAKNDEALHGFEKINAALENMSDGGSQQRLQDAIGDLESLAQQAHKYTEAARKG